MNETFFIVVAFILFVVIGFRLIGPLIQRNIRNYRDQVTSKLSFHKKKLDELRSLVHKEQAKMDSINQTIAEIWEKMTYEQSIFEQTNTIKTQEYLAALQERETLMMMQNKKRYEIMMKQKFLSHIKEVCMEIGRTHGKDLNDQALKKLEGLLSIKAP